MSFRSILSATIVLAALGAPHARAAGAALPRSAPEAQGISSGALLGFVEAADKINAVHSVMVVRHGRVVAEAWWKPEAADKPHTLNSLSKSFTATAVGLAIEGGKLSLDDRVLKFFPADAPADPSDNLKAMTVRDLLTMSGGHDTEPARPAGVAPSVKLFLAHPVVHKPGTHFQYNGMGTYTLSAIVTKVTGQTVLEYLKPRLFDPLGITNPEWPSSPEGNSLGANGLKLRTEDVAKFGQLYLQKGKWNGEQLIPEKWIEQATSKQVPNDQESHSKIGVDWRQGYGFQFWRCTHDAFRGDGAGGQLCVVIPDKDAVVVFTADTGNFQGEMNAIWEKLLPAFGADALPPDAAAGEKLKRKVAGLEVHPAKKAGVLADGAKLEKLAGEFTFTEGPACDADGNVYFTDQPSNRILKYDVDGKLTTFMQPCGRANGLCFDRDGNLLACADAKGELWRINVKDKSVTALLNGFDGKLLNGPNDVWVRPDGGIYFTDPFYRREYWPAGRAKPDQDKQCVYFVAPGGKEARRVEETLLAPNGIIGSPDGKTLYVADIDARKTYQYAVGADGSLSDRKLFCGQGSDGMTIDDEGNVYLTGHGVDVYDPAGKKVEHVDVPEPWCGNVCFGAKDRRTLFVTASKGLYGIRTRTKGAGSQ